MRAPSSARQQPHERSRDFCAVRRVPTTRIVRAVSARPRRTRTEIARQRPDRRRCMRSASYRSSTRSSSPRENSESTAIRATVRYRSKRKRAEIIPRVRRRVRLHAQPRDVVHRRDDRQRRRQRNRSRRAVQQVGARAARALRQHDLVPHDAAVETPRIERRFGEFDDVDTESSRSAPARPAHVFADAGRRADCELRVERDPQRTSRSKARTISAFGSMRRARAR